MTYAIVGALALTVGSSRAIAQNTTSEKTTASATTSSADVSFIKEAAMGGLAEVELGKLATQKASSADVKQFGQRMVDDHSKANDQLKPLAQRKNVTVPTELTGKEKTLYDRLSKLSGPAFDAAYMRAMVDDHRKDVAAFRRESERGADADVKQFASSNLPTLEDHLKMAQSTAGATSTTGLSKGQTKGTSGTPSDHGAPPATDQPSAPSPTGTPAPGR